MKLFVYGSLRRGEAAHPRLSGATLLARAWTEPRFTLVDMGGYPALVEGGDTAVLGEIYQVDAGLLVELDAYEEAPDVYRRQTLGIAGEIVEVYVLPAERAAGYPRMPHGDWCSRTR